MREFKVGDVCRIRQWDDMKAEFGGGENGSSIKCEYSFTEGMRYLCGQIFTVSKVISGTYYSEEQIEYTRGLGTWSISGDMLEYADLEDDTEFSDADINIADLIG